MSRVILVTGANTGIGFELVRLLAEEGHKVYLGARNEAAGKEAEQALKKDNLDAEYIHLDVTDQGSITTTREHIERSEGRLDVLVNNAGAGLIDKPQIATNVDISVLREAFEPNLFGLVQTTTTLLPLIRKAQQGPGVILNVSSELASNSVQARPNMHSHYFVAYNTSKAAANSYTIALNHELRLEGSPIRVNCITPGYTSTKLNNFAPGGKTPKRGAKVLFPWALLDARGPTGLFIGQDGKEYPW